MPEQEMPPQANDNSERARRFTITARANESEIVIKLPSERQPSNYMIVKKDIPAAALNQSYGGKQVKWINCFGVRLRDANRGNPFIENVSGEQFDYEVIVPTNSKPEENDVLVYFDGKNVRPAPNVTTESDGYHFKLNIGDPPTGWGGGG